MGQSGFIDNGLLYDGGPTTGNIDMCSGLNIIPPSEQKVSPYSAMLSHDRPAGIRSCLV